MKRILAMALLALLGMKAHANGVFFSEYIESAPGNNKALEIYNATGATIDMSQYAIWRISNGGDWVEGQGNAVLFSVGMPELLTDLSVGPGETFTVVNSGADIPTLTAEADVFGTTATFFNGDDAMGLAQNIAGVWTLIDVIGEAGPDPGSGWTVNGVANGTVDHTLVRMPEICDPTTDWATGQNQWIVYDNNTVSYFGSHTASCGGGDTPPAINALQHLPAVPSNLESVTVSANVTDNSALTAVELVYTLNGGADVTVAMILGVAPSYSAVIPAQATGTVVAYRVEATDDASQTTVSSTGTYTVAAAGTVDAGDLVITEIMNNPAAVADNLGEWFELYNASGEALDLFGLTFQDAGGATFTVSTSVVVEADGYVVLGNNGNTGTNGGVPVDYAYPNTFILNNSGSESLIVLSGATTVDRVDYAYGATPAWPLAAGASFYLLDVETDNNVATNWTLSTIPYGLGDFGTPGGETPSDVPPVVANVAFSPLQPTSVDAVTVTADVTDDLGLVSVSIVYTVDGGAAQTVAMTLGVAPQYSGVIPAQADLSNVSFHVEATDTGSYTTTSATSGYSVSDSFPCADISTIRENNANGEPVLSGQVRSVCGVVTMSNQLGAAGPIYITGDTGSMALYGAGFVTGVTIGDEIQATGTVGFFSGLTELVTPTYLNIVGHPGEPAPVATTLVDLAADGESFEAQFVDDEGYQLIPRSLADFYFTGNQPPSIGGVAHAPYVPTATEPVTVTATVVDDVALTSVSLAYQVNGGGFTTVPMSVVSGDVYGATIPAQADLAMVEYYVTATDDQSETSTGATYSYTVYNTFPCGDIAAMRVLDENGVPVMVNQRVFVCGTVTATNQFDATRGPVYITGPTGSMAVYGTAALPAGLQIGDEYQAIGVLKNYNGLVEVDPTEYSEVLGSGTPVAPLAVTLADLIATPEAYEARLVEVSGLTLDPGAVWPAPGSNATLTVWQGTDSFALQIDRDTDLDEGMAPAGTFTLRALVGQYDTSSPFDAGYQLLPRFQADILTALEAPVVDIVVSSGTATLSWPAVAGATDYVVYTSINGYDGWDAGVSTAGATSHVATVSGRAFFQVVAVN